MAIATPIVDSSRRNTTPRSRRAGPLGFRGQHDRAAHIQRRPGQRRAGAFAQLTTAAVRPARILVDQHQIDQRRAGPFRIGRRQPPRPFGRLPRLGRAFQLQQPRKRSKWSSPAGLPRSARSAQTRTGRLPST
jgi:hypothetical protein